MKTYKLLWFKESVIVLMKKNIELFIFFVGIIGGVIGIKKKITQRINEIKAYSDKHLSLFLMMNQWVRIKQEGKNLSSYFKHNGYKKIAIYGMSYVGKTLVEELNGTGIEIIYGIDKNANNICADMNIVPIESDLEKVDVIVITAITFYDDIKEQLYSKISCPVVSIEDILFEV